MAKESFNNGAWVIVKPIDSDNRYRAREVIGVVRSAISSGWSYVHNNNWPKETSQTHSVSVPGQGHEGTFLAHNMRPFTLSDIGKPGLLKACMPHFR